MIAFRLMSERTLRKARAANAHFKLKPTFPKCPRDGLKAEWQQLREILEPAGVTTMPDQWALESLAVQMKIHTTMLQNLRRPGIEPERARLSGEIAAECLEMIRKLARGVCLHVGDSAPRQSRAQKPRIYRGA